MWRNLSVSFRTLVIGLLPCLIDGMANLSPSLFQARSLEELQRVDQELNDSKRASKEAFATRRRHLQELGWEDSQHILADLFDDEPGFHHGVASGDPLDSAVIVWTRYTPQSPDEVVTLDFRMAAVDPELAVEDHLDPSKNPRLHHTSVSVDSSSDFVAKLDVVGLQTGTAYVYAFADDDGRVSPVGQTKTAPGPEASVESMTYAVFSCSHFSNGYFHAYDLASTITDLDFWIHVGDYVYEYGAYYTYATDSPERNDQILPLWEQITLQDHRNRMATYHLDEGLRNLRRRAPMISVWDDHELTNNPWGQGTPESTGAENHQETCPVNSTSPDEEKNEAQCDRDEGDIIARFNAAAQSYFEWMPIRHVPGTMGVVDVGSITQVISWGDMATIVAFDTRISHRSKDPTLNSSTWGSFFAMAAANADVSLYRDVDSEVFANFSQIAADIAAILESDEYTMIGEDKEILREHFTKSTQAGQPWQIWASATAVGRAVKGDYSMIHQFIEDPIVAETVQNTTEAIFADDASTFLRALTAQSVTSTPWNRDDYGGFAHEQREILAMLKEVSNNPIILAGDLHDGYGWQLYEDGAVDGTPCAVNLVCPGVTSPGWGPVLSAAFGSLSSVVGGDDEVYSLLEMADEEANPGLKYFNSQYKGFYAVKATKETHIAEFFVFTPETILANYTQAREANDNSIVASYACDAQLTTTAGQPGSLDRQNSCSAILFDSERPAVWEIPFPMHDNVAQIAHSLDNCGYQQCNFDVRESLDSAPSDPNEEVSEPGMGTDSASHVFGPVLVMLLATLLGAFL